MNALHRPAPLDLDAVALAGRPLDEARMLPAAAYLDEAVLAWERDHLFAATWMCLGRADMVDRPGRQVAVAAGPSSVLVARDGGGVLQVVANVCRHRGHELLPVGTPAERNVVQCPYHAWTYELDGRLRSAPKLPQRPAGADDLALVPVRHAEWGGWLFVDMSGGAPDLAEHLGGLAAVAHPWLTGELVVAATHTYRSTPIGSSSNRCNQEPNTNEHPRMANSPPIQDRKELTTGDFTDADEPLRLFADWFAEASGRNPPTPAQ